MNWLIIQRNKVAIYFLKRLPVLVEHLSDVCRDVEILESENYRRALKSR